MGCDRREGAKKFIVGRDKTVLFTTLLYRDYADETLPLCAEKVDIYLIAGIYFVLINRVPCK